MTLLSRSTVDGGVHASDGFRRLGSHIGGEVTGEVSDLANDIDGDGVVTPLDAMLVINELIRNATMPESESTTGVTTVDSGLGANAGEVLSPRHVLAVVNDLNHEEDEHLIEEGPLDFIMAALEN
jgi:hypothetical protein